MLSVDQKLRGDGFLHVSVHGIIKIQQVRLTRGVNIEGVLMSQLFQGKIIVLRNQQNPESPS